jgi:hypothetical protein
MIENNPDKDWLHKEKTIHVKKTLKNRYFLVIGLPIIIASIIFTIIWFNYNETLAYMSLFYLASSVAFINIAYFYPKTKTRMYILGGIIISMALTTPIFHMYLQYGEIGIYIGIFAYMFIIAIFAVIYFDMKNPRPRGQRQNNRMDIFVHHDDGRPPRRQPFQQDDRISPMFGDRAERFANHKWDVVDNYGYFGRKKKRK